MMWFAALDQSEQNRASRRHAVVNVGHQLISVGRDHRKSPNPLARSRPPAGSSKKSYAKRLALCRDAMLAVSFPALLRDQHCSMSDIEG
jgi:hypothetical protein